MIAFWALTETEKELEASWNLKNKKDPDSQNSFEPLQSCIFQSHVHLSKQTKSNTTVLMATKCSKVY